MTPDEIARRCADLLWAGDRASAALGMTIEDVGPGRAELSMTVLEEMTNGHGMCHGGYIFTLADSAFAFACNTHNQRCVAQHCSIVYLAPAAKGARLTASARERQRVGRNGVYDVAVRNESGAIVADFRGLSRTVAGTFF
jgi:acyl-CoA thioesterase